MANRAPTRYTDPRAHELRERYLATYGGGEIPVPVESIAEDLLGLRIEEADLGGCSGMLVPSDRLIRVNAAEADPSLGRRRWRFTIAHELGHWICHVLGADSLQPTYCRSQDLSQDADRALERQANVFGAELLMPESSVREQWALLGTEGAPSSMQDDAVKRVASRFDVSTSAMWYRLYSFSLVPTKPDPAS